MIRNAFLIQIVLMLISQMVYAQESSEKQFNIIYKYHNKSMLLRWAPNESWLFEMGQKSGYKLEKTEFNGQDLNKIKFEQSFEILPIDRKSIESQTDTSDAYQLIAAELLYGKVADSLRKAPLNNAGNTDEIALRNAYQQNRRFFGLLAADYSFKAAEMLGLGFKDAEVEENKIYIYRISPIKTPKGIKPDTLMFLASAMESPAIQNQKLAGKSLEKMVMIQWPKEGLSQSFSGFNILRSADGKVFNKINDLPYKPLSSNTEEQSLIMQSDSVTLLENFFYYSYTDTIGVNYKKHFYALEGIDAFGLKSIISDTIPLMAKDLTPPESVNSIETILDATNSMKISWMNPTIQSKDVAGIFIEKGIRDNESLNYQKISGEKLLPSLSVNFIDKDPIQANICYYRVNVVDTSGNVAFSTPKMYAVEDLEPPLNPDIINADLDTSGVLTITYSKSRSRDTEYYLFYYAFEEKDEFIPFDSYGTQDTIYVLKDFPVRQLNKHIYLKMISVDFAGNMSKPTAPIKVKIPDVIPPLTPTLQQSELRDKILFAKYEKSGSNDVLQYLLQRSVDNREWQTFETRSANKVSGLFVEINDTIKEHGVYHRVRVIAVDESYLYSNASEYAEGRLTGKDRSKPCKNATAKYDIKMNRVELNWSHDEASFTEFIVYRKVNNGKSFFLGKTKNLGLYIDRDIKEKGTYKYIIIAITNNKGEATPTEISIDVE